MKILNTRLWEEASVRYRNPKKKLKVAIISFMRYYHIMAKWNVEIKKKVKRGLMKLPRNVQEKALALAIDLRRHGINPGKKWKNFSPLSKTTFHCHLNYSYVACWEVVNEKIRLMEVYYVGSREDAPY